MTAEESSIHPYASSMAAVHEMYRSALAAAPAYIESAADNDHRRALIVSFYTNVLASIQSHHLGEEAILFPRLMERAPEQRDTIARGTEQHEQVLPLVAAAGAAVVAWESEGDPKALELARALASLGRLLSVHLDDEEDTIVPLAIEHVTPEEWAMIPAHGVANFKGDKLWLIVGLDLECRTPDLRAAMLDNMSPQWREWWDDVGAPSFNAMMAEVRQTD